MKRTSLLALALILAVASAARSQEAESTRSLRLPGDHRQLLADLLDPIHPEGTGDLLDRVGHAFEALRLGDRATFRFPAVAEGEMEYLEMEISSDLGDYVRFRGSGAPFRVVRDSVEARWRRSLIPIRDTVRLAVGERVWPRGSSPTLRLSYRTVREFSCDGYRLAAGFSRIGDTLRLDLWGVARPRGLCGQMISPARGGVELDVAPGAYELVVHREARRDVYELAVTDSTVRLRTVRATFTAADTRLILRRPPNSFALYCGTTESRAPLCDRLRSWVAARPGVTMHTFPVEGVVPYRSEIGTHHAERHDFRYDGPSALEPVRSCFRGLERVLSGLRGTSMTVELWNGELVRSWPDAAAEVDSVSEPHAPGSPPCLPSVPPLSVDPPDAGGPMGGVFASTRAGGLPCTVRRRMEARRDSVRAEARRRRDLEADSTIHVPAPVALSSPWQRADDVDAADRRPRRPWNGSRSAVDRKRFHHELREWLCRDEDETLGDAEDRRGTPWFWVEEGGDWFYLRAETTAEGVEAYLELVDRHGADLVWRPLETPSGGSEPVAVGPAESVLPGFAFYRWRP